MHRVNLFSVDLTHNLDTAGFRHRGAPLRHRLGTARVGAGLYEADAGIPIWPYHYHHGDEEWLLVLDGAPVLREPAGRRSLAPGDLVCFPDGPVGAHTVEGPGRFVIFSAAHPSTRWSVYPDSDKVDTPEGLLPRSPQAEYFHREGTGELDAELVEAPPLVLDFPSRPVINLAAVETQLPPPEDRHPGFLERYRQLGSLLGAERIAATLYAFDPGEGGSPYHYEWGREEWALVLAGAPTLRHPGGEDTLVPGDLVGFPEGPAGAHRLINRTGEPVRALCFSTTDLPAPIHYVDSDKWFIHTADSDDSPILRGSATAGYWEGEV